MRFVDIRPAPAEFSATVLVATSSTTKAVFETGVVPKVKAVASAKEPPATQPDTQFTRKAVLPASTTLAPERTTEPTWVRLTFCKAGAVKEPATRRLPVASKLK